MRTKSFILLLAAFAVLTLSGCGSNGGSGGSDVTDPGSVETVGIVNCSKCHSITSPEAQSWLTSTHGNPNMSPAGPHDETSSCQPCHNQLLDGDKLPAAYIGETARSIVSCESCHGGGSAHRGVGPIPYPRSGWEICGPCHDNMHGLTVGSDFTAENPHLQSLNDHVYTDDTKTAVMARCSKCHSDEGAWRYRLISGDHDQLVEAFDGVANLTGATAIECRTCHTPHAEETTLLSADEVFTGSNEYNTCTNCHQLTYSTADGGAWMQDAYHAPPVNQFGAYSEIISDTHFDDPETNTGNTNVVEGYVVRADQDTACSDCHNLHNNDNTINSQWARSGHGGFIAEIKTAAEEAGSDVFAAGVDKSSAPAWTYYNWDDSDGLTGSSRSACQRCHTATGAANFMEDPDNYDPQNNDFSHLDGWTSDNRSSGQNEMLYCWGCHSNAGDGELRDPGAITEEYDPLVIVSYPDVAGSNVCMTCHLGLETGEVIKTKSGFDDLSFVNSHYLSAGGQVFAQTGYTYDNRDYSIPDSDPHVLLGWEVTGIDAIDDNYTEGPCVTCHFDSNDGSHTLSPFTQYAADDLALNPVCVNCHSTRGEGSDAANAWFGHEFTVDDLVAGELAPHKGRYLAGLQALKVLLDAEVFYFQPSFPYFFSVPGSTSFADAVKDWTGGGNDTDGMNNMGACFNYNLLIHDPGGVAHNRRYTRRLIYDAIDWIDDKQFNYSVNSTLNVLDDATTYKTSAISYLLNGDNGDASDRH